MTTTVPSRSEAVAAVEQRQADYLEKLRKAFVKLSQQWDGTAQMTLNIVHIDDDATRNGDFEKIVPIFVQELRDQGWTVEQYDRNQRRYPDCGPDYTWQIIHIS